jgi:hypothetical protein
MKCGVCHPQLLMYKYLHVLECTNSESLQKILLSHVKGKREKKKIHSIFLLFLVELCVRMLNFLLFLMASLNFKDMIAQNLCLKICNIMYV